MAAMDGAHGKQDARQAALVASIEASPIATVLTNPRLPDNPLIAVNAAFCALTGYAASEIIGRNCRFLAGPETEPWQTEAVREAIRTRQPRLAELLNYRKDGTPFRNALLIAPVLDDDGEAAWFLGSQVEVGHGTSEPLALRQRRAARLVQDLSPRQHDVLREIAKGSRNKQIAWRLKLSEKTVKMHRGLLLQKLGVRTTADAIRVAVEAGL
jgi:PAS domain S-box-containing protein